MARPAVQGVISAPHESLPVETATDMTGVWIGIAGLLVASIIGALLIHAVRRHYAQQHSSGEDGFTLQDLRALRDTGRLTDAEYDHLLGLLVGTRTPDPPPAEPKAREVVRNGE